MKSYEQIAQAAYAAYAKQAQRGGIGPVPDWEDLGQATQQCWIEAVKQTAAELALVH